MSIGQCVESSVFHTGEFHMIMDCEGRDHKKHLLQKCAAAHMDEPNAVSGRVLKIELFGINDAWYVWTS